MQLCPHFLASVLRRGQILQPTLTPMILRTKIRGDFRLRETGYVNAVIAGTDADRAHEMSTFTRLKSAELNIEVFGLQSGKYFVQAERSTAIIVLFRLTTLLYTCAGKGSSAYVALIHGTCSECGESIQAVTSV